jgi:SAM-dependent methyltransferase
MKIVFDHLDKFQGWRIDERSGDDRDNVALLKSLIVQQGLKRVCEVGAGANPALDENFIAREGLTYIALDEHESELEKAKRSDVAVFDICAPDADIPGAPYDLVYSRMTAEHFRDADAAHRNMFRALRPGGFALHSFATLYSLPFLANRLIPDGFSELMLSKVRPRDKYKMDKFRAYYSRCRGPVKGQIMFFEKLGYEVSEYYGYFGHTYYAKKLPWLHKLHRMKTDWLLEHPIPALTSYATVMLRRPLDS